MRVALGQGGQVVEALGLGEPGWKVQIAVEPYLWRNLLEELIDRRGADGVEHRLPVGVGG